MLRSLLSLTLLWYVLHTATIANTAAAAAAVAAAAAASVAPYCNVNETIIKTKPVLKTRMVVRKPTGPFKIFKKNKLIKEEYVDYESFMALKVKHVCCEGYQQSERLKICEPVCDGEHKCPENAVCFEPNQCKCRDGYGTRVADVDAAQMICEPVCAEACPENGHCAQPNICKCERGYRAVAGKCIVHCSSGCPHEGNCVRPDECECKTGYLASGGTCAPICERGQGCLNGKCVDAEECICNKGYKMNPRSQLCEAMPCEEGDGDCVVDGGSQGETSTEENSDANESKELGLAADEIDSDLDESEKISLSTPNTLDSTYSAEVTEICGPNFIYYNGQCREAPDTNEQVDCRFKPCTENAACQANGSCACVEGYTWYKPIVTAATTQNIMKTIATETAAEGSGEESTELGVESGDSPENMFVSSTESIAVASEEIIEMVPICITVQELSTLLATAEADNDDDDSVMEIFFIALGVACIICAAIFLIIKTLHHQRGHMTVGAKNDLCCEYDNKSFREKQIVL